MYIVEIYVSIYSLFDILLGVDRLHFDAFRGVPDHTSGVLALQLLLCQLPPPRVQVDIVASAAVL